MMDLPELSQFNLENYGVDSYPILECNKCKTVTHYSTRNVAELIELATKHTCSKEVLANWETEEPIDQSAEVKGKFCVFPEIVHDILKEQLEEEIEISKRLQDD